jgi:hypothetical protein
VRGKTALISVTVLSLAVSVVSSVNAIAASRTPATGASASRSTSARAAARADQQLYDPVGINGVAQSHLLSLSQSVTSAMSARVLAGVALNTHAGKLNLYLANTSSGVRATAMAAVPLADRSLIRIHHVPLSESALNAKVASTGTVVDRLVSARIPVQSYYADFESGKVVVTLYKATAAQRSLAVRATRSLPVRIAATRTAIASIKPVTARATSPTVAAVAGWVVHRLHLRWFLPLLHRLLADQDREAQLPHHRRALLTRGAPVDQHDPQQEQAAAR